MKLSANILTLKNKPFCLKNYVCSKLILLFTVPAHTVVNLSGQLQGPSVPDGKTVPIKSHADERIQHMSKT